MFGELASLCHGADQRRIVQLSTTMSARVALWVEK